MSRDGTRGAGNRIKNPVVMETVQQKNGRSANDEDPELIFCVTATLTSAAAATPVTIISDAQVGPGRQFYFEKAFVCVNGAVAWTTTATLTIRNNNAGTTFAQVTTVPTALAANAKVLVAPGQANISFPNSGLVVTGTGGTAGKGVEIVGDVNGGAGSDAIITLFGVIR